MRDSAFTKRNDSRKTNLVKILKWSRKLFDATEMHATLSGGDARQHFGGFEANPPYLAFSAASFIFLSELWRRL